MQRVATIALLSFLCVCCTQSQTLPETLRTAYVVAERDFDGFKYGDEQKRRQVNCVIFLGAVVEETIGRPLSAKERKALYINYEFEELDTAVSARDARTRGVQRCVVDMLKLGERVPVGDVRPGDLIQYWYRSSGRPWAGHAAIVSRVWRDDGAVRVALYGAHRSTDGIADTAFGNGLLLNDAKKIYICRFKTAKGPTRQIQRTR